MNNIKIDATERAPEIDFDFDNNRFAIRGESYPEDVSAFYGPTVGVLRKHLDSLQGKTIRFDFDLVYFNSSSAKIFMGLFETLDKVAENNTVAIQWFYAPDDDNMEELGEEFGEELKQATFKMIPKDE